MGPDASKGDGMKSLICIAAAAALVGCSSSTRILVSDPSARIYVNGEYVGTGKGYYSDRKPAFTRQEVTVRKEGCAEESYSFRRNERPDVGAIVSAYYLVLPIFWFTQYKDRHAYEFDCQEITSG
jgi:hypothetical protein